jgi:AcrR family transcriptional regulator
LVKKIAKAEKAGNGANRDQDILEAAIHIFAEKGYVGSSLQEVADAVGLMKGSLYHYISSKESLLYRMFQEAHEQANLIISEVDAKNLGPEQRLREFVRSLAVFYVVNQERASIYFRESRHLTGQDRETVKEQQSAFRAHVRSLVEDVHKAGLTRSDLDIRITSYFLLTAVNGIHIFLQAQHGAKAAQTADQIADLVCSAILTRDSRKAK